MNKYSIRCPECSNVHYHNTDGQDMSIGCQKTVKDLYVYGEIYRQVSSCELERAGDVSGPPKSVPNTIPVFDDCDGRKLKHSLVEVDCFGNMTLPESGGITIPQDNVDKGYVMTSANDEGKAVWKDLESLKIIQQLIDCVDDLKVRVKNLEHYKTDSYSEKEIYYLQNKITMMEYTMKDLVKNKCYCSSSTICNKETHEETCEDKETHEETGEDKETCEDKETHEETGEDKEECIANSFECSTKCPVECSTKCPTECPTECPT